jgi:hypothetical protein
MMAIYVGTLAVRTNPDAVLIFDPSANGDVAPIRRITGPTTGLSGLSALAVDTDGTIYVSSAAESKITIYDASANGDVAPLRTIKGNKTGLGVPDGLALDSAGNLYVLNTGGIPVNRTITVYSPGANGNASPIRTLTNIQIAGGNLLDIAVDASDFLYLSEDIPGSVSVYAPGVNGAVTPVRRITGAILNVPSQMGFDSGNNLYVSDGFDVLVFGPSANGAAAPIRRIIGSKTGLSDDFSLAVDADGFVYVGNFPSDFSDGSITVYAPGADGNATPVRTIFGPTTGLGIPTGGIAIDRVPPEKTQDGWRWCPKCQGLFYAGNPTSGYCPALGGHDYSGSGNYAIAIAPAKGQTGWRWCHKCQGLFYAGNATSGYCPALGGHDYTNSAEYVMKFAPAKGQSNWRWCHKCQGLFFAGNPTTGYCPALGGHDYSGSADYVIHFV